MEHRRRYWVLLLLALVLVVAANQNHHSQEQQQQEQQQECDIAIDGTCNAAAHDNCADEHERCMEWARKGECDANPRYMLENCQRSCGVCLAKMDFSHQFMGDTDKQRAAIEFKMLEIQSYVYNFQQNKTNSLDARNQCSESLKNAKCVYWATRGECNMASTANSYMNVNCNAACKSCHWLDLNFRCPLSLTAGTDVWKPGDLNRFFENLTQEYEEQSITTETLGQGKSKNTSLQILSQPPEGPWVVVLDNFISPEEANRLIELGSFKGYNRSVTVGKRIHDLRTSTNTWCKEECMKDAMASAVVGRIANMTQIPQINGENLQLLKYEVGQFYKIHHDYIKTHHDRQSGVRILTVFLYLNDVEEGGATRFPSLNLTVYPKTGRALIWPSVLDEDPHEKDKRTVHEAMEVKKGVKYGANSWLHQRDFQTPLKNRCTIL